MKAKPHFTWAGMDLITLRLFVAACEEGNLAKAAARENIALSACSKRISALEARYGVDLLHRHDRGVRPTAAGQRVLPRVQGLFALLDQVAADLYATGKGEMGLVRVQAHMTAVSGALPSRIASFLEQHPGIDIELDEATSAAIVHAVQVGTCDVGFISGTVDAADLQCLPWAMDQLVAALPSTNPLAARDSLNFIDLLDFPFISMQRDSALLAMYKGKAAEIGRHLHERMHVTSFEAAKKMVETGLGVTILPSAFANEETGALKIRPLRDAWATRQLVLCVRDMTRLTKAASLLVKFLDCKPAEGGAAIRGEG